MIIHNTTGRVLEDSEGKRYMTWCWAGPNYKIRFNTMTKLHARDKTMVMMMSIAKLSESEYKRAEWGKWRDFWSIQEGETGRVYCTMGMAAVLCNCGKGMDIGSSLSMFLNLSAHQRCQPYLSKLLTRVEFQLLHRNLSTYPVKWLLFDFVP